MVISGLKHRKRRRSTLTLPVLLAISSIVTDALPAHSSVTQSIRDYFNQQDDSPSATSVSRTSRKIPRKPTLLSGYGGSKAIPLSAVNSNRTLWVRNDGDSLKLYSSVHNTTLRIRVAQNSTVEEIENESLDTVLTLGAEERWIGLEKLYGVYPVANGELWVWIVNSETDYEIEGCEIHRINEMHISYVPDSNASATLTRSQRQETTRQIQLLRQALKHHEWYYTSGGDLFPDMTRSLQTSMDIEGKEPWWEQENATDERFFWNHAVLEPLRERKNETSIRMLLNYSVPVTSAFCGVQRNLELNGTSYDQILITRRNRFRAGTRFTRRGADRSGNVANYAETEQMVVVKNTNSQRLEAICSHVQTRGSIPLRWSSPTDIKTYRPRVRIGMDPMAQAQAMRLHLIDQCTRYVTLPVPSQCTGNDNHTWSTNAASLVFVNLVDKKSDQGRLGRAMSSVLDAVLQVYDENPVPEQRWMSAKFIEHIWYDFHAKVKNGKWDQLNELLTQLEPSLESQGYCKAERDSGGRLRMVEQQRGVVRTNCMDCLDRTNVVQSIFGRYMLFSMLKQSTKPSITKPFSSAFKLNPLTLPWSEGEEAHRLIWADNADAVSRLYAGTPALKGDFTRTGKRTKRGALDDGMNSLQRYYLNNFLDADRQEGMDLLTGHQAFSHLQGDEVTVPEDLSDLRGDEADVGFSLGDAARRMIFGDSDSDDESDFELIKDREGTLDLLWLPGDLQSQVRSLVSFNRVGSNYQDALVDIDRRASSGLPWWFVTDSSDDEEGENIDPLILKVESTAANNAGYLLGAMIAGTHVPGALTSVVVALVAFINMKRDGVRKPF